MKHRETAFPQER